MLIKVELTSEDNGERVIRTLEGDEAEQWGLMCKNVSIAAHIHGMNADWDSLNWKERRELMAQPGEPKDEREG